MSAEARQDPEPAPADGPDTGPEAPAAAVPPVPLPSVPGYEVQEELGRGGMGTVYLARQLPQGRVVALKMLREGTLAGPGQLARFRAEAEALSSMEHPNFLQVHEVGQHQGRPYLALQFADGGNLAHLLARRLPTPHETAQLVEILAWAMHYAHARGIVHRDLKPANV